MLQPRCGNYCSKIETKVRRSSGHQSDPNLSPRLLPSRSNVDLIIFDFFLEQKSSFWHTMWQSRAMCALPCARGGKANWLAERGLYKGHSHSSIWHLVSQSFLPGAHHGRQVGKCFICVGMEKKKSLITLHICAWFLLKLSNSCFLAFIPRPPDASQLTAAEENRQRWPSSCDTFNIACAKTTNITKDRLVAHSFAMRF